MNAVRLNIHIRSKYDTNITALIISDGVIPKSRRRRLKKRMNMSVSYQLKSKIYFDHNSC